MSPISSPKGQLFLPPDSTSWGWCPICSPAPPTCAPTIVDSGEILSSALVLTGPIFPARVSPVFMFLQSAPAHTSCGPQMDPGKGTSLPILSFPVSAVTCSPLMRGWTSGSPGVLCDFSPLPHFTDEELSQVRFLSAAPEIH